jgi:uncharacterized membrane protein
MADTATPQPPPAAPAPRRGWLTWLLIASLAANLLVAGGAVASFVFHARKEPVVGVGQSQLVPRRFFGELSRSRRMELLAVFRNYHERVQAGRLRAREQTERLAVALEAEPYDAAAVGAAVSSFTSGSAELMATGGEAALALIGQLTPEERRLLARHIRLRDHGVRHRGGN